MENKMRFRKLDYVIASVVCFFLGIIIISQFFSGKEYKKIIEEDGSGVIALEVAKLTKTNADLRNEVSKLTVDLENYKNSAESRKASHDQYLSDLSRLDRINGEVAYTGKGIVVDVDGKLSTPQIVDLVNAIKNVGSESISVNDIRIVINSELSQFGGSDRYEIKVIGDDGLLKSALERKGGIIDQISTKDIHFSVFESDRIEMPKGSVPRLLYSKIAK